MKGGYNLYLLFFYVINNYSEIMRKKKKKKIKLNRSASGVTVKELLLTELERSGFIVEHGNFHNEDCSWLDIYKSKDIHSLKFDGKETIGRKFFTITFNGPGSKITAISANCEGIPFIEELIEGHTITRISIDEDGRN